MKVFALIGLAGMLAFSSGTAFAQTSQMNAPGSAQREFIMSCTYGVLAGTLIGAASLAFVDRPSENLNKVARGASIGLYAGILLGLYVVYVVPGMEADPYDNPLLSSKLRMNPLADLNGKWDGAELSYQFLSF